MGIFEHKVKIVTVKPTYVMGCVDGVEGPLAIQINEQCHSGWEFVSMTTHEEYNTEGQCNTRRCLMVFKREKGDSGLDSVKGRK